MKTSMGIEYVYKYLDVVCLYNLTYNLVCVPRSGSRAAATSKMECFVIIVNGWKSLAIITNHSILDVAAALDSPLMPFRATYIQGAWMLSKHNFEKLINNLEFLTNNRVNYM